MSRDALELATIYSKKDNINDTPSQGVNVYIFFNLSLYPHVEVTPEMVLTKWYRKGGYYNYSTSKMITYMLKNPEYFIKTLPSKFLDIT